MEEAPSQNDLEYVEDDFDFLAGVALSRLGIVPGQFYDLTPVEFDHAIRDHDELENVKYKAIKLLIETNQRTLWEAIRWQTMYIYNANAKREKQVRDPKKLGKFSWEEIKKQTPDQMKRILFAIAGKKYEA